MGPNELHQVGEFYSHRSKTEKSSNHTHVKVLQIPGLCWDGLSYGVGLTGILRGIKLISNERSY